MTISVPLEKLERLRDTLHEWSPDRVVASEEELRSLIGRLLHLCAVVRLGKYFVRRMLNRVGLPPASHGERKVPRIAYARTVVSADPLGSCVPRRRVVLAPVSGRRVRVSGGSPLRPFVP